ncbi:hypothetical protein [Humibacillus sp. DSM 29435]|uniref:hypothetical protein n=1 Tax=Humibacillus sp. DSM 29435 TaxID=1869167 RepID=UPI000AA4A317|nr:hypothetical protein [Humibacillus sp. DSM 29435]
MQRRREPPTLNVDELPLDIRKIMVAAIDGAEIAVVREGREVGHLSFHASVLEGVAFPISRLPTAVTPVHDGVTVVATAMRLPELARSRLSDEFGPGYIVLDLQDAPESADVVLTHPVSPQLLAQLRGRFPEARMIITEIEDEELGISYSGPVGRLLAAGASAYLPPLPVSAIASNLHAYLTQERLPGIEATSGEKGPLPPPLTQRPGDH